MMLEDVLAKYVESGWLQSRDHAALVSDLEKLTVDTSDLMTVFNNLRTTEK